MSYDLIIFEKSNMPTGRTGFLNWYDKKWNVTMGRIFPLHQKNYKRLFMHYGIYFHL